VVDVGGPPLLAALDAEPWLVKVNVREAAEAFGLRHTNDTGTVSDLAERLLERGARNVLITRGREGAVLRTRDGIWTMGPPPVTGPFSVGSGDALIAGLAVGLSGGQSLPEAFRYGGGVAAANALVPGQGLLDQGRIDEIVAAISLTEAAHAPPGRSDAAG
jgi:fructose-1-phosphate kinase PfkB-like protein